MRKVPPGIRIMSGRADAAARTSCGGETTSAARSRMTPRLGTVGTRMRCGWAAPLPLARSYAEILAAGLFAGRLDPGPIKGVPRYRCGGPTEQGRVLATPFG